jgi:hypothetical protein
MPPRHADTPEGPFSSRRFPLFSGATSAPLRRHLGSGAKKNAQDPKRLLGFLPIEYEPYPQKP